jgi:hypothetical protein
MPHTITRTPRIDIITTYRVVLMRRSSSSDIAASVMLVAFSRRPTLRAYACAVRQDLVA